MVLILMLQNANDVGMCKMQMMILVLMLFSGGRYKVISYINKMQMMLFSMCQVWMWQN